MDWLLSFWQRSRASSRHSSTLSTLVDRSLLEYSASHHFVQPFSLYG
jgi:hypothetical protein